MDYRAGCSRLINEQMAGALWVARPCVQISHVGVAASGGLFCLPICTGDPPHFELRERNVSVGWKFLLKCYFLSYSECSRTFMVTTSPDNKTDLRTLYLGLCSLNRLIQLMVFTTIHKQLGQPSAPFLQVFYLSLPQLISWSDVIGCALMARWPWWTAMSSSWPWKKNRLSRRRGLCQTSLIMRRDWCKKSANQFTQTIRTGVDETGIFQFSSSFFKFLLCRSIIRIIILLWLLKSSLRDNLSVQTRYAAILFGSWG